jgi:hypothetical protein
MEHTASPTALRKEKRPGELRALPAGAETGSVGVESAPGRGFQPSIVFDRSPVRVPPPLGATPDPEPARAWPVRQLRRLVSESGVVMMVAFTAYLTVALLLDFKYRILPLDAVSRMANGYYVLWSNDPHWAAIGFVWSPLQSIADISLLIFKPIFPVLSTHDLAGSLVSVCAGVGAVHQVHAALREWGVRRAPRLALTLVFGVNPMILYYAGNGMSDMLYTFLLVLTMRYFLRWIQDGGLRSLVYAGSALGLAYLNRYEAIGAAGMAAVVVLGVSYWRNKGPVRRRFLTASSDATIFLAPLGATFMSWAVASFVITGQAFAGVSSQYGTAAQTSEAAPMKLAARTAHLVHNLEYLAPLLPVVLVLAIAFAARRRDLRILAPLAILGGSVTFDTLGLLDGFLEPWYRYFMMSVPLDVMLVGCILARGGTGARAPHRARTPAKADPNHLRRTKDLGANIVGVIVVVALLGVSVPSSGKGIFEKSVQASEKVELGALFLAHPPLQDRQWTHHFAHIQSIDAYIDRMHLPDGSIVADTFGECTPQIVTSVTNSKIFVITNDRDFQKVLADPLTFGAHYLLVPQPVGVGLADALNEEYPTLYSHGAGFARLVHQFPTDGTCAVYRLYRVTGHNGQTSENNNGSIGRLS